MWEFGPLMEDNGDSVFYDVEKMWEIGPLMEDNGDSVFYCHLQEEEGAACLLDEIMFVGLRELPTPKL